MNAGLFPWNLDLDQKYSVACVRSLCQMNDMQSAESLDLRPATAESKVGGQGIASKRLARERQTLAAMIACFCEGHHHVNAGLCPECRQLLEYATRRLERCRFGAEKPVCAKCPVHCYQRLQREQVRVVMRYAGPRMPWQHPVLSLRHWLDGFRKAPSGACPRASDS